MSEEGGQPFMNPKQREALDRIDRFQLTTVLSKFCLKNCGVFKAMKEKNYVDLPQDCLSIFFFIWCLFFLWG